MRHRSKTVAVGILVALTAASAARDASANSFTAAPSGFSAWNISIDGAPAVPNPDLLLLTDHTYTFTVSASLTHPFWIKTVQGNGSANGYTGGGLSANGVTSSTSITFTVPINAPATLFYNCGNHMAMTGKIHVIVDPVFQSGFEDVPLP